jgi:hypothetical protein
MEHIEDPKRIFLQHVVGIEAPEIWLQKLFSRFILGKSRA